MNSKLASHTKLDSVSKYNTTKHKTDFCLHLYQNLWATGIYTKTVLCTVNSYAKGRLNNLCILGKLFIQNTHLLTGRGQSRKGSNVYFLLYDLF